LTSRQPEVNAFEHEPTQPGLASVTPAVRRAADEDTDARAPSDSVTSTQAQLSASSKLASTTAVDPQPVIASAAVAAVKEPGIISRLLAPFGIDAQAATTDTPIAPVSATTLMGALELVRRELERIFVNATPSFTYDSSTNVAANGAITGKVTPVDSDSTAFSYTATSPAEGDVVIDSNGNFTFTPNASYDPNTGTSFAVTISDASSGFHLHGLSSVLNLVTFGLIGESGHTHTGIITLNGGVPAPDFHRTVVVSGLNQPTDFRFLPAVNPNDSDEADRVLIAEKGGAIRAYSDGQMQDQPVLTIPVATNWARGINGIEVDPGFNENGYIYASYIGADNIERLSRFTVTDPTASVLIADPQTEKVLLAGDEPAGDDHHGGEIRYIDGKLYWATGDNVCCSVVDGSNSQDLSSIYGKVLRINPDGTVPTDNPYYNVPGARKEIYATGLRNPFRGGVTPDGQLLLGDVGQNTWEEINLVSAGANFGWPYAEGVCPGPGECKPGSGGTTTPIYAYQHGGGDGSSITSVLVYDGDTFGAQYDNAVFFADHNQQWVKAMQCDAGYTSCGTPITVVSQGGGTTRLAQGPDGSIYQMTLDGTLWRIAPSDTATMTV
jgi:glucose/arabinose dehydrogenase